MEELYDSESVIERIEEYVEVPNTEFVSLIVGRNGYKIKAIRERTNTFIKTPMRTEKAIFKIVGTAPNVAKAKREIEDIVQRLKLHQHRYEDLHQNNPLPENDQDRRILQLRVPFRLVGLVVGYQGSTIKEIQAWTKTNIQTPAHGGEPIFELSGGEQNVILAKAMIQNFIQDRTGFNVQDFEEIFEEAVDPYVMHLLYTFGINYTINEFVSSMMAPEPEFEKPMQLANFWEQLENFIF